MTTTDIEHTFKEMTRIRKTLNWQCTQCSKKKTKGCTKTHPCPSYTKGVNRYHALKDTVNAQYL